MKGINMIIKINKSEFKTEQGLFGFLWDIRFYILKSEYLNEGYDECRMDGWFLNLCEKVFEDLKANEILKPTFLKGITING